MIKRYLLASDFDQTLSFNDSGVVLSDLIGFGGFHDKVAGLSNMNLVQQGAELSYLILHDPEFRHVRREHLVETGKRIRLKHDVALFARSLETLAEGYRLQFQRYLRRASGDHPIGARRDCSGGPDLRHPVSLQRSHRRSRRDHSRHGRVGQNYRTGGNSRCSRHQPRQHHLYGRRQLRSSRHDAREPA